MTHFTKGDRVSFNVPGWKKGTGRVVKDRISSSQYVLVEIDGIQTKPYWIEAVYMRVTNPTRVSGSATVPP
jgi:hypothetical protein